MKKKGKNDKAKADEIVRKIGEGFQEVRRETERMKLHHAAKEYKSVLDTATLIVTVGAEVLQDNFNLTVDETAAWASLTLKEARERVQARGIQQERKNGKA